MDFPLPAPKRLKSLASNVQFSGANMLLHQFVLLNSDPNTSRSENDINAFLMSLCDTDVNASNGEGYTALHLAVLKKNNMMVRKLLSCLPDIDIDKSCKCEPGNAALHLAAELGHVHIMEELLNKGANRRNTNLCQNTALCCAAQSGDMAAVEFLVSRDTDIRAKNIWSPPAVVAARNDRLNVVKFFLGRLPNIDRNELLLSAASHGSMKVLHFLITNGADVNCVDGWGHTPLHFAVEGSPDLAAIELLVSRGANVHAQDEKGRTMFHAAAQHKNFEVASFLIERGADLHLVDKRGRTPLHAAAEWGNAEYAEWLICKGVHVNARDAEGRTPLHYTCPGIWNNRSHCAEILVESGADVNARDENGETPLCFAIYWNNFVHVLWLLKAGADVNLADRNGQTPLHAATRENHPDIVRALLESGARWNAVDKHRET